MQIQFPTAGKQIGMDIFTAPGSDPHPIVCALHGSGGLRHAGHLEFAQLLADRGFFVCVPHYFEISDTGWASPQVIYAEFPRWLQTISDALNFAAHHPRADGNRIGLVGFSLGAYLALSLGTMQQRIRAVVDFFGGMPEHFLERFEKIAPVLILHGQRDNVVSIEEAHKLARLLDSRQLPYEMQIYPNAAHGFGAAEMFDAGRRTYEFLKKHLGQ